jgi:hypothetical protein
VGEHGGKTDPLSGAAEAIERAWGVVTDAVVTYEGRPVGTVAACDPETEAENYDQVFVRDFFVSGLGFLVRGEFDIVRNFLLLVADLQSTTERKACFEPGKGLMPASFSVHGDGGRQAITADFGERAIGRVAPVDSGFWWLYLLRAYVEASGDHAFLREGRVQEAVGLILDLALTVRYDMAPTMLVPDGGYTIDRRLGVYGYPIDIQALFYAALRAALEVLPDDSRHVDPVAQRVEHLTYHLRKYYWLDFRQLNRVYRFRVEEYGEEVVNAFNIYPESIPKWVFDWMPDDGGYFLGNLGPGRMDARFFAQGNLLAVLSGLADTGQGRALFDLYAARWDDLAGAMPLRLCWPALEGRDWEVLTGADRKNEPWSYHNGGSWPFLLWALVAAALRHDGVDLARRALEQAAARVDVDGWPEYYDGPLGRLVGKEARAPQTWTAAGFAVACAMLRRPEHTALVTFGRSPGETAGRLYRAT